MKSALISVLAAIVVSLPAFAADAADPVTAPEADRSALDGEVQSLRREVVDLNRDLFMLEEDLLFPASTQVAVFVSMDVGNPAKNVIPAKATAIFNIRFNDTWTAETLQAEIHNRLDRASRRKKYREGREEPIAFELVWLDRPSDVFLTRDEKLVATLSGSIHAVTGRMPALSTTGGTSDARFIKNYCPVVEFGLVGKTMHMVDERVALTDLETLTNIYSRFLEDWFG